MSCHGDSELGQQCSGSKKSGQHNCLMLHDHFDKSDFELEGHQPLYDDDSYSIHNNSQQQKNGFFSQSSPGYYHPSTQGSNQASIAVGGSGNGQSANYGNWGYLGNQFGHAESQQPIASCDQHQCSLFHYNFQEQLREKIDVPQQCQQYVSHNQLLQSTLRKLDRLAFCRGTLTCSSKSVYSKSAYSVKEDILSEEQDGEDQDSVQEVDNMDEQDEIDDEIQSAESGESEESRSPDLDTVLPNEWCYYCKSCNLRREREPMQNQNEYMQKVAKLNYQNLKLIQENDQDFQFKHTTTTRTTTTTTKSCCSNSIVDSIFHKKTVRTMITEDQLSNCSYSKRSLKGSEYGGSVYSGGNKTKKDIRRESNLSDISSLAEQHEMALALEKTQSIGCQYCPGFKTCKKGPSSITSVKTAYASYHGNINHAMCEQGINTNNNQKNVRFNIEEMIRKDAQVDYTNDKTQIRKWTVNCDQGDIVNTSLCFKGQDDAVMRDDSKQFQSPLISKKINEGDHHQSQIMLRNLRVHNQLIRPMDKQSDAQNKKSKQGQTNKINPRNPIKFGNWREQRDYRMALRKNSLQTELHQIDDNQNDDDSCEEGNYYQSRYGADLAIKVIPSLVDHNDDDQHMDHEGELNNEYQDTKTFLQLQNQQLIIPDAIEVKRNAKMDDDFKTQQHSDDDNNSSKSNASCNQLNKRQKTIDNETMSSYSDKVYHLGQCSNYSQVSQSQNLSSPQNGQDSQNLQQRANSNSTTNNSFKEIPLLKTIGPLTLQERSWKVLSFWDKKRRKTFKKKVNYVKRKKVADKKLRIKGRFVTTEQAIKMLGMSAMEVQKLIKQQNQGGTAMKSKKKKKFKQNLEIEQKTKIIKINNAQVLFQNQSQKSKRKRSQKRQHKIQYKDKNSIIPSNPIMKPNGSQQREPIENSMKQNENEGSSIKVKEAQMFKNSILTLSHIKPQRNVKENESKLAQ